MITRQYARTLKRWLLNGGKPPRKPIRIVFEFEIENPCVGDEEGEDCLMLEGADVISLALMDNYDVPSIRLCQMTIGKRKLL